MYCVKCGSFLPDGARFCASCGAAVEIAETASAMPTPETQDTQIPAESYDETFCQPAPEQYSADENGMTPAPKGGKKKLVLLITAAVLALAILVGGVLLISAYTSAEARLARAFGNTAEQFSEITDNAEDLQEMFENLSEMEGRNTVDVGYRMEYGYMDLFSAKTEYRMQIDRDVKNRQMAYSLAASVKGENMLMPEQNEATDYRLDLYMDEDRLMASMPGTIDEYYSLPLDDLGEKLRDSDLGALMEDELDRDVMDILYGLDVDLFAARNLDGIKKLCPREYEAFMDTVVVEALDRAMPCDADCEAVYYVTWDMERLGELVSAYYPISLTKTYGTDRILEAMEAEDMMQELEEFFSLLEAELYFGVSEGMLTAIHADLEFDGEKGSVSLVLKGQGNPWGDFSLYADDEEVMTGGFTATAKGFELSMVAEGEELLLVCDDRANELILEFEGEELAVLAYSDENDSFLLAFEINESEEGYQMVMECALEIRPLNKIEKPKDAIDLLRLDENELYDLYETLENALYGGY